MKMLRNYIILFIALAIAQSCKRDNMMLYEGGEYVQFKKSFRDSSMFSFLATPTAPEGRTALILELIGKPMDKDRTYRIVPVKEASTATEAHYAVPASFTLKANKVSDTAWITLKNTADLTVKPVRLVLKIEPTDDLKNGQIEYSLAILNISNVVARPDWWNVNPVEWYYMGDYSDKKYKLFIQVTGKTVLDATNVAEIRYYTILFKNYLLREKDAGRTVYEDNGTEMTVALLGG